MSDTTFIGEKKSGMEGIQSDSYDLFSATDKLVDNMIPAAHNWECFAQFWQDYAASAAQDCCS